jgi:hypothetical protein
MIHFVAAGKTITISVLRIAQVNVPAAIQGYRFKYAKTRQTVFIAHSTSTRASSRQGKHYPSLVRDLTMEMYFFTFIIIILDVTAFGPSLIHADRLTYQPRSVGETRKLAGKEHSFGCLRECPFTLDHRNHRC